MRVLYRIVACLVGLLIYLAVFQRPFAYAVINKAGGGDQPCPWPKLMKYPWNMTELADKRASERDRVKLLEQDKALGITRYQTSTRPFWLKSSGELMSGGELLAYVIAEQNWLSTIASDYMVKPGDVVMDVGAHVGTFGDDALRRGASKVIMVEIDPVNVECIRRNYAREIAQGRVIVVPEGAWSKEDTLEFAVGVANSGTGSLVLAEDTAKKVRVPVRTIDSMVQRLKLDRLNFIKMDIEGAEREALKGAAGTLQRFKPRLFLDAYHLPDDSTVLPKVILAANNTYQTFCAVCSQSRHSFDKRIVPYAIFFR